MLEGEHNKINIFLVNYYQYIIMWVLTSGIRVRRLRMWKAKGSKLKYQEICKIVRKLQILLITTNNIAIQSPIPKFTSKNFNNWCIYVCVLLRSKDLLKN